MYIYTQQPPAHPSQTKPNQSIPIQCSRLRLYMYVQSIIQIPPKFNPVHIYTEGACILTM